MIDWFIGNANYASNESRVSDHWLYVDKLISTPLIQNVGVPKTPFMVQNFHMYLVFISLSESAMPTEYSSLVTLVPLVAHSDIIASTSRVIIAGMVLTFIVRLVVGSRVGQLALVLEASVHEGEDRSAVSINIDYSCAFGG